MRKVVNVYRSGLLFGPFSLYVFTVVYDPLDSQGHVVFVKPSTMTYIRPRQLNAEPHPRRFSGPIVSTYPSQKIAGKEVLQGAVPVVRMPKGVGCY